MSIKDFILNGGLFGMLRGFDHRAEGRPYGFAEFDEDSRAAMNVSKRIVSDSSDMLSAAVPHKHLPGKEEYHG